MTRTRVTEIAFETEETVVLKTRRILRLWCDACSADVVMARPETAATLAGVRPREIYRRVESGALHFRESADGTLLVCLGSLVRP